MRSANGQHVPESGQKAAPWFLVLSCTKPLSKDFMPLLFIFPPPKRWFLLCAFWGGYILREYFHLKDVCCALLFSFFVLFFCCEFFTEGRELFRLVEPLYAEWSRQFSCTKERESVIKKWFCESMFFNLALVLGGNRLLLYALIRIWCTVRVFARYLNEPLK